MNIFESNNLISSFKVSESPLWSLDWSHPRFGNLLAVSAFDGEVSIWKGGKEC